MRIEDIEKMLVRITPGPWELKLRGGSGGVAAFCDIQSGDQIIVSSHNFPLAKNGEITETEQNFRFMADAPVFVRHLIGELRLMHHELQMTKAELQQIRTIHGYTDNVPAEVDEVKHPQINSVQTVPPADTDFGPSPLLSGQAAKLARERRGDWCETLSGKKFYPIDPRKEDFDLVDMCHGVSREGRYANQTLAFHSVGQHLLLCEDTAQESGFSPFLRFLCLTHDLPEAYLRDIPSPVKKSLPGYQEMEDRVFHVMWNDFFGLRQPTEKELDMLHFIDALVAQAEAIQLGTNQNHWVTKTLLADRKMVRRYSNHIPDVEGTLLRRISKLLEEVKA